MSEEKDLEVFKAPPQAGEVVEISQEAQEELRRRALALKDNLQQPSTNTIRTGGKVFTLPDGQKSPGPMFVVVLDFVWDYRYFATDYEAGSPQKADCWAIGRERDATGKLIPDPKVPNKQADNCGVCPMNKFKSARVGKGKACKNQRRLLVANPSNLDADPMSLFVSPTGIRNFDSYVTSLATSRQLLPQQVITKISFDVLQTYPTLVFEYEGPHNDVNKALAMAKQHEQMLFVGPNDTD